tara:strand:- start:206 stop:490 length:285 start_codon:yes stop_codon:yes gene_type:complete
MLTNRSSRKKKRDYRSIFKTAAVIGAGSLLGFVPQFLIGMTILLIGLYIFNKSKKEENKEDSIYYYFGIGLMILGSVLCLGLGFDLIINGIFEE